MTLNSLFLGCCHLLATSVSWALADGPNATHARAVPWNLLPLPVFGFKVRNLANHYFWQLMLLNSAAWTFLIAVILLVRRFRKSRKNLLGGMDPNGGNPN